MTFTDEHVLMIEPRGPCAAKPVIDEMTRRMAGALAGARTKHRYRGIHDCTGRGCHASSDNADHFVAVRSTGPGSLPGELMTNSLAVHYLAFHRGEVPPSELDKVGSLAAPPAEPTIEQLTGRPAEPARAARVTRGPA